MAGAFLRFEWDDKAFIGRMSNIEQFGPHAIAEAAPDIGEYLLISTRDRADAQVDPERQPWVPLSPKYKKWKEKKRPGVPMLRFDFHMLGDQLNYQIQGNDLVFGTNAVYGAIHQFGGTVYRDGKKFEIPARPWLGVEEADGQRMVQILIDRFKANVPESG